MTLYLCKNVSGKVYCDDSALGRVIHFDKHLANWRNVFGINRRVTEFIQVFKGQKKCFSMEPKPESHNKRGVPWPFYFSPRRV